jgi:Cu+-exporting ATPase
MGRGARNGILFRNARHLEAFRGIKKVIFDKTGTLTTGDFTIHRWHVEPDTSVTVEQFRDIVFSLERYSNHPIARSIVREWKHRSPVSLAPRWAKVEEIKGLGMRGETKDGEVYWAGRYQVAAHLTDEDTHSVYLVGNDRLLGTIDLTDEIRPEAPAVVKWFNARGIHTVLLSGDRELSCLRLAEKLDIREVLAEQTPEQKSQQVARLNSEMPVAMVGDGINDAPALARATIGVSLGDASQLAVQTADVVLMNRGLRQLPAALELGRQTYSTIRANLFWAFFYNVIAIPVAAFGLLTPAIAALVMGLSDVVLVGNSLRLHIKKIA